MDIRITSRHAKSSENLKEAIHEELSKLEKYTDKITSCHVILDSEHVTKTVEINISGLAHPISAHAKADSLGKALSDAVEKIGRQLKKLTEKIKTHKAIPTAQAGTTNNDATVEEDEEA